MGNILQTTTKAINDLFENHGREIYSAVGLILLVDILFTIPFLKDFLQTGQVRNFMVFGSPYHAGSFIQFAKHGIQWLAFVDTFIFAPVIIWSMLMPTVVAYVRKMQREEE